MDHTETVSVRECISHFACDSGRFTHRQLALAYHSCAERLSLDVRHDVEDEAVNLSGVVQRKNVRMSENGRDLDLAEEPCGPERGGDVGGKDLDRHSPVVPQVLGEVNGRHATVADLALDPVA